MHVGNGHPARGSAPTLEHFVDLAKRVWLSRSAIVVILVIGVGARTVQYLAAQSFWLDEAMLALNVARRGFAGILQPLDYVQVAPPLYLLATELATRVAGVNELGLRLVPFLAGLVSLGLVHQIGRQIMPEAGARFAALLFAVSDASIRYTCELKQYSVDVACVFVVLAVLLRSERLPRKTLSWLLLATVGAIVVWCSYPIVFVLAAAGLILSLRALTGQPSEARKVEMARVAAVGAVWVGSFAAQYLLFAHGGRTSVLVEYWAGSFAPFPPLKLAELLWYPRTVLALMADPVGYLGPRSGTVAILAVTGGVIWLLRERRPGWAALLLGPAALAFVASASQLYPVYGRLMLYSVPGALLLMAAGVIGLAIWLPNRFQTLAVLPAIFLLVAPVKKLAQRLWHPVVIEDPRGMVAYMQQHRHAGDAIYVYYGAVPGFLFYTHDTLPPGTRLGTNHRDDPGSYWTDLEAYRGQPRVWVLLSHPWGQEHAEFVAYLDTIGTCLESGTFARSAALLYDLASPPVTANAPPMAQERTDDRP